VEDLTPGTSYLFRVSAENTEGTSKPLEMTESVTPRSTEAAPADISKYKSKYRSILCRQVQILI